MELTVRASATSPELGAWSSPLHAEGTSPSDVRAEFDVGPRGSRFDSLRARLPAKSELINAGRKLQLLLITATMSVLEIESRNLLALMSAACVGFLQIGL